MTAERERDVAGGGRKLRRFVADYEMLLNQHGKTYEQPVVLDMRRDIKSRVIAYCCSISVARRIAVALSRGAAK